MINSLLKAVRQYGQVVNFNDSISFSHITQDTRRLNVNDIYIAIKGERFDGHDFIQNAIDNGASAIITEHRIDQDICQFVVEDTLAFLQLAANIYRNDLKTIFIGITGTNGKTTTKEMIHCVLSKKFNVYRTPGNYNNHIGLPLSILNMPKESEVGILEIGTNHPGEIAFLTKILNPDLAIITNIGYGHMEFFNSLEDVYKEKTSIFRYMKKGGVVFKNVSDPFLIAYHDDHKTISFGLNSSEADYSFELDASSYVYNKQPIRLMTKGEHFAANALAAFAIARYLNISEESILYALSEFQPISGRMNTERFSNYMIINDAYNANPNSMLASLQMLQLETETTIKIAVLGDMLEMGAHAAAQHQSILTAYEDSNIDQIFTYGDEFAKCTAKRAQHFSDKKEIAEALAEQNEKIVILFKGSRGMALETIIDDLKTRRNKHVS